MAIRNFAELENFVAGLAPIAVAVAAAADGDVLGSLLRARRKGFVGRCFLCGDPERVRDCLERTGGEWGDCIVLPAGDDAAAAREAVRAVREDGAALLVKGSLKSEYYLRAILDRDAGIRASAALSNLSLFEMPSYHKFLAVTDNAIVPDPSLEDKAVFIENTRPLWRALGVAPVKVGLLAAVETVSPRMAATTDAAVLCAMSARGRFPGFLVEGPLGYDALIDRDCARAKGLGGSPVCGDPDLVVAPNLETANALGKSYKFHGGAAWGGMVFGAAVPAVLNSRTDDGANRYRSLLIARAVAEGGRP